MTFRWVRFAAVLARHPALWPTAWIVARRLAPPRWWARPPFLPVPDREYLRFRLVTAYGDPERTPDPDDLITYLHWCRAWPRIAG